MNTTTNTTTIAVVDEVKWISDLLLLTSKYNQTYFDVAAPLIPHDLTIIPLICIHVISTLLNGVLLSAMLMERQKKHFKIKILITSLTLVHFLWSAAWVFICLTSAFFATDQLKEDILTGKGNEEEREMKELLWEIVGRQIVDNLYFTIILYFMAVSLERYLNLLPSYDPYANNVCCKLMIIIFPWLLAYTVFDYRLLALVLPIESAVFCRLCLLIIPSLLSLLFSLISCLRPAKKFESFSSLNSQLPILLFLFSFINILMNTSFFFQLLEANFSFVIIVDGEYENRLLTTFFDCWFWISHCLIHLWSLFFSLSLVIFVKLYRNMTLSLFSRLRCCCCCCCCSRKKHSIYSEEETLRSVIGPRNLVSSIH